MGAWFSAWFNPPKAAPRHQAWEEDGTEKVTTYKDEGRVKQPEVRQDEEDRCLGSTCCAS